MAGSGFRIYAMAYSERMRFAFLIYLFASVTSLHAEKPFDFASTPGKLPKQVRPTEYAIWVKPDLKKLAFAGRETVKLKVAEPTRELILNALDLRITDAEIDGKTVPKTAIKFDAKNELLTIATPEELTPGEHTLALRFTGKINQFGRGLFYAKYQEQGTGAKKMLLGTQFEATDARRLFPCWDEPVFRARFQLSAVVPENWMAVSNMPVASEKKVAGGREVEFQPTPLMSSYLNVFCAGEFDAIESQIDGVKLRITTTKGKAESARYALEATAQILHYYNEYFGVPYPLPKLDQLAIPGGFGGAMENWGGITYYETALLFDPANSSAATKQRVYEVIAHEVAHQWFGDLVTMAWWDNLWLNEGFASWMGSKCTAHLIHNGKSGCAGNFRGIQPAVLESPRKQQWKATLDRPLIRSNSRWRPKPKRTTPSTISPTKRGSRFSECWKVFSAKMCFAKEFAVTWRRIGIQTPRQRTYGMRFP